MWANIYKGLLALKADFSWKRLAYSMFWAFLIGGLLLAMVAYAQTAHYRHHGPALLNDASVTPGAVRTTDAKEVCSETTKQFRNTTESMKKTVYVEYSVDKHKLLPSKDMFPGVTVKDVTIPSKKPLYEVDHLISLELGGADEIKNLWPQPYYQHPGAREKDTLENWLHKQVCAGKMSLADAQKQIATDWYAVYLEMQKGAK